ncbi:hypothetical protein MCP1_460014 [Candidatus Terasakiella magnetica]|nr:hypothetical protein MCP1_460014 [Candidatus Terasakiella magnetica]
MLWAAGIMASSSSSRSLWNWMRLVFRPPGSHADQTRRPHHSRPPRRKAEVKPEPRLMMENDDIFKTPDLTLRHTKTPVRHYDARIRSSSRVRVRLVIMAQDCPTAGRAVKSRLQPRRDYMNLQSIVGLFMSVQ